MRSNANLDDYQWQERGSITPYRVSPAIVSRRVIPMFTKTPAGGREPVMQKPLDIVTFGDHHQAFSPYEFSLDDRRPIWFKGICFPTGEHLLHAMKVFDERTQTFRDERFVKHILKIKTPEKVRAAFEKPFFRKKSKLMRMWDRVVPHHTDSWGVVEGKLGESDFMKRLQIVIDLKCQQYPEVDELLKMTRGKYLLDELNYTYAKGAKGRAVADAKQRHMNVMGRVLMRRRDRLCMVNEHNSKTRDECESALHAKYIGARLLNPDVSIDNLLEKPGQPTFVDYQKRLHPNRAQEGLLGKECADVVYATLKGLTADNFTHCAMKIRGQANLIKSLLEDNAQTTPKPLHPVVLTLHQEWMQLANVLDEAQVYKRYLEGADLRTLTQTHHFRMRDFDDAEQYLTKLARKVKKCKHVPEHYREAVKTHIKTIQSNIANTREAVLLSSVDDKPKLTKVQREEVTRQLDHAFHCRDKALSRFMQASNRKMFDKAWKQWQRDFSHMSGAILALDDKSKKKFPNQVKFLKDLNSVIQTQAKACATHIGYSPAALFPIEEDLVEVEKESEKKAEQQHVPSSHQQVNKAIRQPEPLPPIGPEGKVLKEGKQKSIGQYNVLPVGPGGEVVPLRPVYGPPAQKLVYGPNPQKSEYQQIPLGPPKPVHGDASGAQREQIRREGMKRPRPLPPLPGEAGMPAQTPVAMEPSQQAQWPFWGKANQFRRMNTQNEINWLRDMNRNKPSKKNPYHLTSLVKPNTPRTQQRPHNNQGMVSRPLSNNPNKK